MEITKEFLAQSKKDFFADRANRVSQRAAVNLSLIHI